MCGSPAHRWRGSHADTNRDQTTARGWPEMMQEYATLDVLTETYIDDAAAILTTLATRLLDGDESTDALVARLVDTLIEPLRSELAAIVTAGVVGP